MNKQETGGYVLTLYDKYGSRTDSQKVDTHTEGVIQGKAAIQAPPHASFTVARITYNSLDRSDPWAVNS